jgi:DNA-binding transcriptional MerR regulator
MPRKYLRITEVTKICGVNRQFVARLEREQIIAPIRRRTEKFYPMEQVNRVRVARLLMKKWEVNLEVAVITCASR